MCNSCKVTKADSVARVSDIEVFVKTHECGGQSMQINRLDRDPYKGPVAMYEISEGVMNGPLFAEWQSRKNERMYWIDNLIKLGHR